MISSFFFLFFLRYSVSCFFDSLLMQMYSFFKVLMHFRILGYSVSSKLNFLSHIVSRRLFSSIKSIGLNPDRRNFDDFCFYFKFLSFFLSLCKIFFLFTNELFLFSIETTFFKFYFYYLEPH